MLLPLTSIISNGNHNHHIEPQGEGVYCLGSCTVKNVWWEDVCEDALTGRGSGSVTVIGGGARNADDKIFQHNGSGSFSVTDFYAENFGKLYRSCGNCGTQYARKSSFTGVVAVKGKVLVSPTTPACNSLLQTKSSIDAILLRSVSTPTSVTPQPSPTFVSTT